MANGTTASLENVSGVWNSWINLSSTLGTTADTTSSGVWNNWVTGTATTATMDLTTTSNSSSIWGCWSTESNILVSTQVLTPYVVDLQERENVRLAAYKRMEKKRELAKKKATDLLMKALNKRQLEAYLDNRCIPVDGKSGAKYVIHQGRAGNIDLLGKDGKVSHHLCAHPVSRVPDEDTMLAQKLMLECSEKEFLKLANKSRA